MQRFVGFTIGRTGRGVGRGLTRHAPTLRGVPPFRRQLRRLLKNRRFPLWQQTLRLACANWMSGAVDWLACVGILLSADKTGAKLPNKAVKKLNKTMNAVCERISTQNRHQMGMISTHSNRKPSKMAKSCCKVTVWGSSSFVDKQANVEAQSARTLQKKGGDYVCGLCHPPQNGCGAPGPNRTDTPLRERDFESRASTSSATGAYIV